MARRSAVDIKQAARAKEMPARPPRIKRYDDRTALAPQRSPPVVDRPETFRPSIIDQVQTCPPWAARHMQ